MGFQGVGWASEVTVWVMEIWTSLLSMGGPGVGRGFACSGKESQPCVLMLSKVSMP
jgi:hypothetical protein